MKTATYTKIACLGGQWGLRVPGEKPVTGEIVLVSKRDGSTHYAKIGRVVRSFPDACLCTIDATREAPTEAEPGLQEEIEQSAIPEVAAEVIATAPVRGHMVYLPAPRTVAAPRSKRTPVSRGDAAERARMALREAFSSVRHDADGTTVRSTDWS